MRVQLLGEDRLGERPQDETVVGRNGVHCAPLHDEPHDLPVQQQGFQLRDVEIGEA